MVIVLHYAQHHNHFPNLIRDSTLSPVAATISDGLQTGQFYLWREIQNHLSPSPEVNMCQDLERCYQLKKCVRIWKDVIN